MSNTNLQDGWNITVDQIQENEWSALLHNFDDATIYQTWAYGSVRWGEKSISHLVLRKGEKPVGAAQVAIRKIPGIRLGAAYIPWGPLWKVANATPSPKIFELLIDSLAEEYALRRGLMLRLRPNIYEKEFDGVVGILSRKKFVRNPWRPIYRTLVLDLSTSLGELRSNLKQKWRNQLNQAERNNLKVREGNSSEMYEIFLRLSKEMVHRKGFKPGVSYEDFGKIQERLPKSQKMRILVAEFQRQPVSVAVFSDIGDTGIYLLGATVGNGLRLKASNLLQWEIIKRLKAKGCVRYDLGGVNPDKNPGVYRFKAGVAGKTGQEIRHIGSYEFCKSKLKRKVLKFWENSVRNK